MKKNKLVSFINKMMFLGIIILGSMIILKSNESLKDKVYKTIFQSNFNFSKASEVYENLFGKIETKEVSKNSLEYSKIEDYKEGAKLTVNKNYLVSSQDDGIVIYSGKKNNYGNTVVIERSDGVDVWYSNLTNVNIQMYDYIKEGDLLGEANGNYIYLVYKKEEKALKYESYL